VVYVDPAPPRRKNSVAFREKEEMKIKTGESTRKASYGDFAAERRRLTPKRL
jgi:hypothetical protein